MCSFILRSVVQHAAMLAAAALSWLPAAAPSLAGPMTVQIVNPQDALAVTIRQHAQPRIQPLYDTGLDTPFGEQSWRDGREAWLTGRPDVASGVIASMGRLGVAVDSDGSGPRIKGLAWTPSRNLAVIAGGNLGGGGLGASLSVRIGF